MTRTFLAPGKVVLLGEYAVVDGAPALVAAVDRGVRCDVTPGPFALSVPDDDRFARAALDAARAPAARYAFSDWNPPDTATKVGLGGSAAAVVCAVVAAFALRGVVAPPDEVFALGHAVHRRVQGSGSGIDVAASAHGGVLRFQDGAVRAVAPVRPVVVYAGSAARTGPRVARYLAWGGRAAFVGASSAIVERFSDDPIAALRDGGALLSAMARDAGIAYDTPALDRIAALATVHGGAAKPSGAGGGDCAVALLPDPDAEAAFAAACVAEGLPVIDVRLAGPAAERPA